MIHEYAQVLNPVIDFSGLANLIVDAFMKGALQLLSPIPTDAEKWLWTAIQSLLSNGGPNNVLTHIPTEDTVASGDVLDLWRQGIAIQAGLIALVIAINGYRISTGQADLWEVFFRVGFLVIMGESVLIWGLLVFNFVNAASDSVSQTPLDIRAETLPNDLTLGFTLIIAAVFALFAWLKGAVGVVFIKVLLVSAPYILPIAAIPKLEGLASWWIEEFTTWTLRAFMVALVLRLGLGIATVDNHGLQFLFAAVSFWLAYQMDTRIRRFSVGVWGSLAQANVFARTATAAVRMFS